jgi:predicted N-acetyltransferase YhbS
MLEITAHYDTDLSRKEIVEVVSLVYGFWPRKDKTIPELVETFRETSKQYRVSYPQIRLPSLRYVIWDNDKAVAHALTFERPVITAEGQISVMALSGVCVLPNYQGRGLGAEIVRRTFGRIHGGEFDVSLFQTTIPAFYEKLGAIAVTNRFVNSKNRNHPDENPWHDERIMIYPSSYSWPDGQIDLNGPDY